MTSGSINHFGPPKYLGFMDRNGRSKLLVQPVYRPNLKKHISSEIRPTAALDHYALALLGEEPRTSSVVEVSVIQMQYRLRAHTSIGLATVPCALAIPATYYLMATGIAFDADLNKALAFA